MSKLKLKLYESPPRAIDTQEADNQSRGNTSMNSPAEIMRQLAAPGKSIMLVRRKTRDECFTGLSCDRSVIILAMGVVLFFGLLALRLDPHDLFEVIYSFFVH